MKRALSIISLTALLVFAVGCGANKTPVQSVPSRAGTATPMQTADIPGPIPAIEGLNAEDVVLVVYYGDSQPPDIPVKTYSAAKAVERQLERLKGIRLLRYDGPALTEEPAPSDWWRCDVYRMDGGKTALSSSGKHIAFGQGYYAYEGFWADDREADTQEPLAVYIRYPFTREEMRYSVANRTGQEIMVASAPLLDRATADGWTTVKSTYGFCGTPDPFADTGRDFTVNLKESYPDAEKGIFRLSVKVWVGHKETMVSDVFVLE